MPPSLEKPPPAVTSMPDYKAILDKLIAEEELKSVFQPIVSLQDGRIMGYEALARPVVPAGVTDIGELFDAASKHGRLSQLEALARHRAFESAMHWDSEVMLFINNSPHVMVEDGFLESVGAASTLIPNLDSHRIVLEITERTDYAELDALQRRTHELREMGFQIALDDVGAGISGLNRIMALQPQWVKLDRELTANIDHHPVKRNLLRTLVHFAKLSNMHLIAEGIERPEEMQVLVELGVTYGQGFYLGRPGETVPEIAADIRRSIVEMQKDAHTRRYQSPTMTRIASLAHPVPSFDRTTRCREIAEALAPASAPDVAVILDGRRYIGLVHSAELQRFVACGWTNAPIGDLKLADAVVVGGDVTLSEALELAAARGEDPVSHPLVVMNEGNVIGAVAMPDLLRAAADTHRRMPSHVASVTGLPSRVGADQWIADRIAAGDPANVVFIDLRNFDAFNIANGFDTGDEMLRRLVGLVNAAVIEPSREECFFAHLREDRFMISSRADLQGPLRQLIHDFQDARSEFFSANDMSRGTFACSDPAGNQTKFDLTSLRLIYLERPFQRVHLPRDLYEMARHVRLADPRHAVDGIQYDLRHKAATARKSA